MKKIILSVLLLSQFLSAQETGIVKGLVTDKKQNDNPLPFANVLIKGTTEGVTTDFDGNYQLDVPVGIQTIVFSFMGYKTYEEEVEIVGGKETVLDISLLTDAGIALEEVVVKKVIGREKEEVLLSEQREAAILKTSIGSQELSRKGIGNLEQAITKITGITKVASRGVFVRGLDERYNYLTVNGLPIAPTNWETKTPDFSQFSSAILKNVDVNKVFYSNFYGDFAGATINVNTKDSPRKNYTKVSFTTKSNFQAMSNKFLSDKENGNLSYFGFGGKLDRVAPKQLSNENHNSPSIYTARGSQAINDFKSDWNTEEVSMPVSIGFGIENADVFDNKEKDGRIAYYIGMDYSNSYSTRLGSNILRTPFGNSIRNVKRNNAYNFDTSNNVLLGLYSKTAKRNYNFNYLLIKTTSNQVIDNYGRYSETSSNLLGRDSNYKQSYLNQFQLLAKHRLNDNEKLSYALTYGFSNYTQPDNNILSLEEISDNNYEYNNNAGKMYKYYLDSNNWNIAGNIAYSIKFDTDNIEGVQNELLFGGDFNNENLDIYNRYVQVRLLSTGSISIVPNSVDESLISAFNNDLIQYKEELDTRFTNVNTAIFAAYSSYNHYLSDKLSVLVGARLETFKRNINANSDTTTFDRLFILPSFNAKYMLSDKMNLRLIGSKTYTKPKNIETVDITRENSVGDLVKGNSSLQNSDNYGLDFKWELFPNETSLISANLFTKRIVNPIEQLVEDKGSFVQTVFRNIDQANIYGLEIELKSSVGDIINNESLKKLTFGTNITFMNSSVVISNETKTNLNLTNRSRKLQGASDMLFNADITYRYDFTNRYSSTFTLMFDTFSKRIFAVGSGVSTEKYNDEYELPFNNLSFNWQNRINEKLSITMKLQNILNDTYARTINTTLGNEQVGFTEYRTGTAASLSVSYTF